MSLEQAGPLTAADLICILSKLPPDQVVCFSRDEGGFSPIQSAIQLNLLENVNDEYWYGPHDYPDSVSPMESETKQSKQFIVLLR